MLHTNLSALDYYTDGRYGYGNGPVFYRTLSCNGLEKTIHNCSSSTGESCSHSSDVGLICTGCSRLTQRHYGLLEQVNVTSSGDVYTGRCSNGSSNFQFLYRCSLNGTWEEYGTRCGPLVNNSNQVDGARVYDFNENADEKSDMWSFGVVLWEVFSMGGTPYENVRSRDLPDTLKDNGRLQKPEQYGDVFVH
ncbi:uncharacterized protein LOC127873493 [Dreissena polymorpha]|uniref:uncharacterized protein LOC127873493 n=1 Tax=Dreissena polymorpha TaxID=45954 RepID=UPI0022648FE4|nr:uncharacterized protein LOC127873493 [Dreissena polymorpha]